nr:MAG TPA: hypothetical protein [Caudoviricetes sp.]
MFSISHSPSPCSTASSGVIVPFPCTVHLLLSL